MSRSRKNPNVALVRQQFDANALRRICQMPERAFAAAYDLETVEVPQEAPNDFYAFRDNGSEILAVAHLDTVSSPGARACNFLNTAGGTVVYSRALDDRLGAYVILDMLPKLGVTCDLLLTTGEEMGRSTAGYFSPTKEYNWIIEFDRGGTDVVMYQYENAETVDLVKSAGARVGVGSFSDICFLEHLGVKAFNWGVGYQDYHSARSHAYLDDTFYMVSQFLDFHAANADTYMPHEDEEIHWSRHWATVTGYDEIQLDEDDHRAWSADWAAQVVPFNDRGQR